MTLPVSHFHSLPGYSLLTSTLDASRVDAGVAGEVNLYSAIARTNLPSRLHVGFSQKLTDKNFDADAVILSGDSVLLIDVKRWARGYTYIFRPTPTGMEVTRSRGGREERFGGGTVSLALEEKTWTEAIQAKFSHATVSSLLVLDCEEAEIVNNTDYPIILMRDLGAYLMERYRDTARDPNTTLMDAFGWTSPELTGAAFVIVALFVLGVVASLIFHWPVADAFAGGLLGSLATAFCVYHSTRTADVAIVSGLTP